MVDPAGPAVRDADAGDEPGFSLVAILSIATGVGANTAMFSVADGLMLRPLLIPDRAG